MNIEHEDMKNVDKDVKIRPRKMKTNLGTILMSSVPVAVMMMSSSILTYTND